MKRTALLPDQADIRPEDLGIKKPYQYDQHAPDIFKHKEILARLIKNNLPGNQKSRYTKREASIYAEQQELTPIQYREPLAHSFAQPQNRVLQPHFVQGYNERYIVTRLPGGH